MKVNLLAKFLTFPSKHLVVKFLLLGMATTEVHKSGKIGH